MVPLEPRASFTAYVIERIRARIDPLLEVSVVEGTTGVSINGKFVDLDGLHRMIAFDKEGAKRIVDQYISHVVGHVGNDPNAMPLSVAKSRIMPRIRPETVFDGQIEPTGAHLEYPNQTVIVYVIDMPMYTVSITGAQMQRWGIDLDAVDRIARENLARYDPMSTVQHIESVEGGRAAIISQQDGYDSARLLLPNLHAVLSSWLGREFYVAITARDMFLAFSMKPKRYIERLRERIRDDFQRLPYPITDRLFIVSRDGVSGEAP